MRGHFKSCMTPEQLRKLQGEKLRRDFTFIRETVNEAERTVELSFSSELPYRRWFGDEILGHNAGEVDFSRLNNKASLLWNHNTDEQIGVVEKAWVDATTKKGRAIVRFSKNPKPDEIFKDVIDGIRTLVSVGYMVKSMSLISKEGDVETHRVTEWEPYEISFVSVPADASVGVGRADKPTAIEPTKQNIMTPEQIKAEQDRINAILEVGVRHNVETAKVQEAIKSNRSADAFAVSILEAKATSVAAAPATAKPAVELTDAEVKQYSLSRAITNFVRDGKWSGFEKDISDKLARELGVTPSGLLVPQQIRSAQNATVATEGGVLVSTESRPDQLVSLLRNKMVARQLGATVLTGLKGNVLIPTVTQGSTAYWVPENGSTTASQLKFGSRLMTPKRLTARVSYTKQLLAQGNPSIDALLSSDLATAAALELDRAALHGTGANGEPLGLFGTTGINTVTFGGAATYAKVVEFGSKIEAANYDATSLKYATTPEVFAALKTKLKASGVAGFIAEAGKIDGFDTLRSKQVSGNKVAFGDWSQLIIGEWEAYDLTVDPYTRAGEHEVVLTLNILADVMVRQPKAFAVSTDAGNQ